MSKELKALTYELSKKYPRNKDLQDYFCKVADLVNKTTPPTAEQLCEALSEYYGRKVTFKDNVFWYKTIVYDNEQWIRDVSLKDLSKDNRGDLITMIGRFYENEVKE